MRQIDLNQLSKFTIMSEFKNGPQSFETETKSLKKTRREVEQKIAGGENLEKNDLSDLDLSGLNLEGTSFRGSDVRGIILYHKADGDKPELITNIKNTDWTEALIASVGPMTDFRKVVAEGATFGYTESLESRRKRHSALGEAPLDKDTGAYLVL
jgi:hypothetical protein